MRLTFFLLCVACGAHPKAVTPPTGPAAPLAVPNAAVPAGTDPVAAAVWTASHLLAVSLQPGNFTIGAANNAQQPPTYSMSGNCAGGGTLRGTIQGGVAFVLNLQGCGGASQAVSASESAVQFNLLGDVSSGNLVYSGYDLQLTSANGKLTLTGAVSGVLGYDMLTVDVQKNDDGTVTFTLDGSATFGGTTRDYASQAFIFPSAP